MMSSWLRMSSLRRAPGEVDPFFDIYISYNLFRCQHFTKHVEDILQCGNFWWKYYVVGEGNTFQDYGLKMTHYQLLSKIFERTSDKVEGNDAIIDNAA